MSKSEQSYFEVFWPRGRRLVNRTPLAPRLQSLEGKTVAQLWDYVFFGDKIFEVLEQELRRRFPGIRFVGWREFGNIHGNDEREVLAQLPQRLKEWKVDAAISGMAC